MTEPMTARRFLKSLVLYVVIAILLGIAFYLGMGSMSAP